MTVRKHEREHSQLGLDRDITRRDFLGSTLIGSGAALLAATAPGLLRPASAQTMAVPLTGLGPDWTGPGGVGDYARSNGNTHEVVNASHAVRNGDYAARLRAASDTGETYDLVIVGAGFAGFASAYRWHKERPNESVLIFDVHPIFGGEAKQNEFEVDGVRLWGPQGSNGNVYPIKKAIETGFGAPLWRELGLPEEFVWQEPKGLEKELRIPPDVYGPMHITWESADQGFYYEDKGFVVNPWANRFKDAPIPEQLKQDMIWMETFRQPPRREDWEKWLDGMTYQQFITDVMGIKSDVASYLNPQMAAMGCGLGTDVASAYSAYRFLQPGVNAYDRYLGVGDVSDQVWLASWPGGNTGQLRYIVKNIIPGAFPGGMGLSEVLFGPVQWQNLDRANEPVRMRLVLAGRRHPPRRPAGVGEVGGRHLPQGRAPQARDRETSDRRRPATPQQAHRRRPAGAAEDGDGRVHARSNLHRERGAAELEIPGEARYQRGALVQ